jgi:hypothetical protein
VWLKPKHGHCGRAPIQTPHHWRRQKFWIVSQVQAFPWDFLLVHAPPRFGQLLVY